MIRLLGAFVVALVCAVPPVTVNGAPAPFRAGDWSGVAGKIAGNGVILYSPESGRFESLIIDNPVTQPRWMADGRQVYYKRGPGWRILDTQTKSERVIDVPGALDGFKLSPDARHAYLLETTVQTDIWLLTIK
jgi:hypothetical protein